MEEALNTLIYKRTHNGDPDESGIFGIHDCMGQVRRWPFDAVIGVGGKNPWEGHKGIAYKINWIGLRPHKTEESSKRLRGPLVKFERFFFWGDKGPALREHAPKLFNHMFEEQHVRLVMSRSLPREMQEEVEKILRWAEKHPHQKSRSKKGDFSVAPRPTCQRKISAKREC